MGKLSAEDRLEQLKAQIAERKVQRQQKLQTPSPATASPPTPGANRQRSKKEQKERQSQERPETQTAKYDAGQDRVEHDRGKKEKGKKREKKKEKLSPSTPNTNWSEDDANQEEEPNQHKQQKPGDKKKERKSKNRVNNESDQSLRKELTGDECAMEESQRKVDTGDDDDDDPGDGSGADRDDDPGVVGGFSMLGNFCLDTAGPVKRQLPDWLANPTIIGGGLKKRKTGESGEKEDEEDEALMKILDDDLKRSLQEDGIESFFPVQRRFVPELWRDLRLSLMSGRYGLRPRDFCVSAPTGSGKTLAYALPIVQCLRQRGEPHVMAVVVLPVRDLAEQVYHVFCHYCAHTPLKVGLVVGKAPFCVEQESLVVQRYPGVYHSQVDILVATPGRLVDHVHSTPGFDLSHLRFLVIDEADRMMEDIKHDWLAVVETAAYTPNPRAYRPLARAPPGPLTMASAPCDQLPLQKLLFSATLSHSPEQLERLNLFMPRLLTAIVPRPPPGPGPLTAGHSDGQEHTEENTETDGGFVGKYTTPEGLTEYLVESEAGQKPLVVLHLLHHLKFRSVLCFTNSVETTHRLCLLVKLFGGVTVKEFSSRLPADRRRKILKQFSKGKIDLLVCSDVMARGMDVDGVKYVVSYDRPPFVSTYIHRVGRTARAGRAGTALSLLENKEFFHFKRMMRQAGKWRGIREMKFSRQALQTLVEPFQAALAQLPRIIQEEKRKSPRH